MVFNFNDLSLFAEIFSHKIQRSIDIIFDDLRKMNLIPQ